MAETVTKMSRKPEYNTLEISGSLLQPGFSIYLLEVSDNKKKGFYVGMTGDHFYPSARSAFHRVSGHLEKVARSTQNQLHKAIEEHFSKVKLADLKITMHHWNIDGFKPWEESLKNFDKSKTNNHKYKEYKDRQKQVYNLEKHLISVLKDNCEDKCLNKSVSKVKEGNLKEFNGIIEEFKGVIGK